GLRRVAGVGESVLRGHLLEAGNAVGHALIDGEGVRPQGAGLRTGMADIDVELAVAVDIGERDTGGPAVCLGDAGLVRAVATPKPGEVEVELRDALVG